MFEDLSILVAEDEEGIRDFFEFIFERVGCKAVVVEDGKQALHAFQENDFDIIISDIHMPKMKGTELNQQIRMMTQRRMPKFFFISGEIDIEFDDLLFDGILHKPFSEEDLVDILKKAKV